MKPATFGSRWARRARASAALATVVLAASTHNAHALLGDAAADLVFVPIAPCRIFDSSVAGGPLVAGTPRGVDVTAVSNYASQGGEAGDCSGMGAAGSFAAIAATVTVVNPNASGTLKAWPFGGVEPTAITMAFAAGEVRSSFGTFKLDQGAAANELTVQASATTHLTIDVTGYYTAPQATKPQCTQTTLVSFTIAAGASTFFNNPACPTGYIETVPYCYTAEAGVYSQGSGVNSNTAGLATFCAWQNTTGVTRTVYGGSICCRVPGRP